MQICLTPHQCRHTQGNCWRTTVFASIIFRSWNKSIRKFKCVLFSQKGEEVGAQNVGRHAALYNLHSPIAEHTTYISMPAFHQAATSSNAFRGHFLMLWTAKPGNAAASTRKHLRVFVPDLITPSTLLASQFHAPGEIGMEMNERRVF
jgi:hypothetical protein